MELINNSYSYLLFFKVGDQYKKITKKDKQHENKHKQLQKYKIVL